MSQNRGRDDTNCNIGVVVEESHSLTGCKRVLEKGSNWPLLIIKLPDTPYREPVCYSVWELMKKRNYNNDTSWSSSTGRSLSLSPPNCFIATSLISDDFRCLEESSPATRVDHRFLSEPPPIVRSNSLTGCSLSTNNRHSIMSESLVTSISPSVAADVSSHGDGLRPTFSSMRSLNSMSDEVDGTPSYGSCNQMANEHFAAVTQGSDPILASVGRRINSLDDMKIIHLHRRSFSAEAPCNKENHCEIGAITNELSGKETDGNNKEDDISDFCIDCDTDGEAFCHQPEATEQTVIVENSHTLVDDCALVETTHLDDYTSSEEIHQVEGVLSSVDGLELPRASEMASSAMDEESCESTTLLLDESMVALVGTPHPMTHIPDGVFTFAERLSSQELPAISEENEEQTLRRQRKNKCSSVRIRARNDPTEVPQEPEDLAPGSALHVDPEMVPELKYSTYPEVPLVPIHRRAISDNSHLEAVRRNELRRAQEVEQIDLVGKDEDVHMRPQRSVVRTGSVISNRCQSQVFLPELGLNETSKSVPVMDRNLSCSDPSVNDEKPNKAQECPPPVILSRKASSNHNDSWKKELSCPISTQPAPVQMRNDAAEIAASRPVSIARTEKAGDRIEKKKTKSGSDTFSFGSLFGANKGSRSKKKVTIDRSLETVLSSFQSKAGSGAAISLPTRRMASSSELQSRLPIPDFEGLPEHLSNALVLSHEINDVDSVNFDLSEPVKYNLNQPLWARFDLFSQDEYTSWHDKYRHDKLNTKVLKKQDAIFELILIEKAHCAHLAFLQQGYRNRLIQENVIPEADVDRLIPDVLDALLVFHLNLLDRLTARQRESDEVETISDILAEELSDDGKYIGIAVNAYTTFGSAKERSEKMFESLMAKNGRFAEFIRQSAFDPMYRRFEFKSIMTRIISRPTKYGLLVETILKNEYNKFTKEWELTQKALFAAKRFAMKIDNNLLMMQMAQRWDDVRSHFDLSSQTNLLLSTRRSRPVLYESLLAYVIRLSSFLFRVIPNCKMEDLDIDVKQTGCGQRRLMCLGDVCMKNSRTKTAEKVFMVLFDDILVCLQRRNNHQKYAFIQQEQSVFPVSGLILRPADRSASVMIISGAITKPALLEVEFNSKTDRTKWIKTLETAIHNAPAKVRLSPRNQDEAARQLESERQLMLKQQKEAEDAWLQKLDEMFEKRNSQERFIQDYMISLMKFFDDLRAHLQTLPLKSRPDVADRIREAVRQHCRELRICRTAPLNRLIENACVAREAELWSFIDVAAEMTVDGDSDGGGSSSDSSASGKGQRPRRIHTFHGITEQSGENSASSLSREKPTIRRHTTVPRMSIGQDAVSETIDEDEERWESNESRREQLEVEEKTHQLPLGLNLKARRAMSRIIHDVVKLKSENNHLRNEISLNKTRLAMKERTQNLALSPALASDTMEALRRKEQEVREENARRRQELEQWAEELRLQQEQQRQQEAQMQLEREQLRRNEAELANKWAALHAASVSGAATPETAPRIVGRISMKSPSSLGKSISFRDPKLAITSQPGISPALRNLTKKSETKKLKK
ncbi:hypothetical protein KIN20_001233 [Parelaphostrongylus tenuis]|uniref:DH domain-containing protein n=1 Tax=Parelaphostrongylus tenuis TaxID=148309 RepID=A0AAD5QCH9_PARTN|nr:hypothetical protein KIN20_001233 [Parelaphostrongylus tenuis]